MSVPKKALTNPFHFNLISPRKERHRLNEDEKSDDLAYFSGVLHLDPSIFENLIYEIQNYKYSKIRNIKFKAEHGERRMHLDVEGTYPGLTFSALSSGEQEKVFIEILCALARSYGRHGPTLLNLDGFISMFFEGWFDYYSNHFLDPDNQFQTILGIPTQDIDLSKVRWNGWQVLQTHGDPPECKIIQELMN